MWAERDLITSRDLTILQGENNYLRLSSCCSERPESVIGSPWVIRLYTTLPFRRKLEPAVHSIVTEKTVA